MEKEVELQTIENKGPVYTIDLAKNDTLLLTAGYDKIIRIYELKT